MKNLFFDDYLLIGTIDILCRTILIIGIKCYVKNNRLWAIYKSP